MGSLENEYAPHTISISAAMRTMNRWESAKETMREIISFH